MVSLNVNGKDYEIDVAPDTPLLWAIRENLKLTGTKYGCGIGECGSCTVHVDGKAVRSCTVSVEEVQGKKITTIEGLPEDHPVKKAWVDEQVVQCGYCQPGIIMQVSAELSGVIRILKRSSLPSTMSSADAAPIRASKKGYRLRQKP
jgi:isoquinoline 1-oxidoreductase alpha subunit